MWLLYSGLQEAQEYSIRIFQLDVMHIREQIFIKHNGGKNYVISITHNLRHILMFDDTIL